MVFSYGSVARGSLRSARDSSIRRAVSFRKNIDTGIVYEAVLMHSEDQSLYAVATA